jgi:hypothetical protein
VANLAKIPVYILIGWLTSGVAFFTVESLWFDSILIPALLVGVFGGRRLLPHDPQRVFSIAVIILAGGAALKRLLGLKHPTNSELRRLLQVETFCKKRERTDPVGVIVGGCGDHQFVDAETLL